MIKAQRLCGARAKGGTWTHIKRVALLVTPLALTALTQSREPAIPAVQGYLMSDLGRQVCP